MLYDLIIIGGGPAGIAAGIYAFRQKLNTLIITKDFGGQINKKVIAIENYPGFEKISGEEFIKKLENHLRNVISQKSKKQTNLKIDSVLEIKKNKGNFVVFTENKFRFQARTIIIASGTKSRLLGLSNEKKFLGRGLSYCAKCDGPLFSDKKIAVIGGGNAGLEAAIALSDWAKRVYILEQSSRLTADIENQEIIRKKKKIKVITNAYLRRISGNQFINSIIYYNSKLSENKILKVAGVFVEIGLCPTTNFVGHFASFNKKGEIKINPKTCQTKTPALFAAGDVTDIADKQIIIAAGEGAKAALSVYRYLQKQKR